MKLVYTIVDAVLDFIYPRNIYCLLCEKPIKTDDEYSLCDECRGKIEWIKKPICDVCGKPLDENYDNESCVDCLNNSHMFTKGLSSIVYNGNIKRVVHNFKYHNKRYIGYHMAEIITDTLRQNKIDYIDYIVPVPMHKNKKRQRGFNQSSIIAKYIARNMDLNFNDKNLIKIRDTSEQNKLNKKERFENLKGAFHLNSTDLFREKEILLVDDIYTTGNTVDACCEALNKANPKAIYIASFATGKNS